MVEPAASSANRIPYVFVLWGDKFEEETATIFVTELRRVGIRVKVIGVNGPSATGLHGLTLRPDLTLGEAYPLAQQAICVVVPCNLGMFKRIQEDPRVIYFLQKAVENRAQLVGNADVIEQMEVAAAIGESVVWIYPREKVNLVEFAHRVANELLHATRTYS